MYLSIQVFKMKASPQPEQSCLQSRKLPQFNSGAKSSFKSTQTQEKEILLQTSQINFLNNQPFSIKIFKPKPSEQQSPQISTTDSLSPFHQLDSLSHENSFKFIPDLIDEKTISISDDKSLHIIKPNFEINKLDQNILLQKQQEKQPTYFVRKILSHLNLNENNIKTQNLIDQMKKYAQQLYEASKLAQQVQQLQSSLKIVKFKSKCPLRNCKTIVIDMDETLIHCLDNSSKQENSDIKFSIMLSTYEEITIRMNIRPKCLEFLQELSTLCELILFTASNRIYATKISKYLDPKGQIFSAVLYRDHCLQLPDGKHIKDLQILGRDLKDVVLIDNYPPNFRYSYNKLIFSAQPSNGIPIFSFTKDRTDTELTELLAFLKSEILLADDVRNIISETFKLNQFANYKNGKDAILSLYKL